MLAFFRWFCHPGYKEDIEGDIVELFQVRITTMNERKARWLFVKDVFFLFRPALLRKFSIWSDAKPTNMKRIYWLKLVAMNLLIVLMIISPFMPGPSNEAVKLFSVAGQLLGLMGLVLVPVGFTWYMVQVKQCKTNTGTPRKALHFHLAIACSLLVAFIFLVGALILPNPMPKISFLVGLLFQLSGLALAMRYIKKRASRQEEMYAHGSIIILTVSAMTIALWMSLLFLMYAFFAVGGIGALLGSLLISVILFFAIKKIRVVKFADQTSFSLTPLYLFSLPVVAFLTFKFLMQPISGFSRDFAIKKADTLIALIENHKVRTGAYPESIHVLMDETSKKVPAPSIMGIEGFRYNKINDVYSLSFSQWLHVGSLEEIVLYDKNDLKNNLSGEFARYDYKFDLSRVNSAFASHDTRHQNWRYYHVD